MTRDMSVSDRVLVAADPLTLWTAVADPTQMPRWSSENTGAEVAGGARPLSVGESFVGSNSRGKMRWHTRCWVTESVPGVCFEFRVGQIGGRTPLLRTHVATWRYSFSAEDGGTWVTETWSDGRKGWPDRLAALFDRLVTGGDLFSDFQRRNINTTLTALRSDFARGRGDAAI